MEVLLCTGLNMCFGNSWELSHRDGSFEYLLMYTGLFRLIEKVSKDDGCFMWIGFDM